MKYIILILIVIFTTGCATAQSTEQKEARLKGEKACIEQGGVPIYSSWSGWMKECQ